MSQDTETDTGVPATLNTNQGQFATALTKSNRQIQRARALQLTEVTKMIYRRKVEDLASDYRQMMLTAQSQLDLRGDSALSINPASKDFDAQSWVQGNLEARMSLRNTLTKLAVAYYAYTELFGPDNALVAGIDLSGIDNARISIPLLD